MSIDALLKKYFPVVVLLLVAIAAYFQASGATVLVSGALVQPALDEPRAMSAPIVPGVRTERKTAEPILKRNPFDSVTGPLTGRPLEVPEKLPEADFSDPLAAPSCNDVQVFIVTESTDPTWSVAALQGSGDTHPRMRRVGDDVGGKHVEFIGFNPAELSPAVWLSDQASLCQALLFQEQPAAAAPKPSQKTPSTPTASKPGSNRSRRGPPKVPDDIKEKIQKVNESEFNVDRGVVDKILEDQAELMRSARIVPEQKDGKVVGIRLFGIRPDTLLGTLGLQNGDRLESINGFNMASPEKALEAYARLRTASSLNVKINRRGKDMSIDYRIK